ncbi:hypothetical protein DE146DRAFT_794150 [Phaeosphaeria sp. MPI-PUGE-AT-0046c]|nr:hypothetical protein DE146DRAFT_794150 [Phaeosphaeria sp. MPI-PUGE-AT-0046c]
MGADAALLKYLPIDMVRIDRLAEEHRHTTARPYQMFFGSIPQESIEEPAQHIRILLHIGQGDGSPDIRYHIFGDDGYPTRMISAKDAAMYTQVDPAFTFLIEPEGIIGSKARAMVRYCFIAKKANRKNMWRINDQLIKDLVAACRTAQTNSGRRLAMLHPARRSKLELEQDLQRGPQSFEEGFMQSVANINSRGDRSRRKSLKATLPVRSDDQEGAANHSFVGGRVMRATRAPTRATSRGASRANDNDNNTSIRDKDVENSGLNLYNTQLPTSQSTVAGEQREDSFEQSNHNASGDQSSGFIATHTKLLDEDVGYTTSIERNTIEQAMVAQEIERQEQRLLELKKEERKLKNERKRAKDRLKDLHHTLSEREKGLLAYGMQLGSKNIKRVRISEGHEGDNGNESQ